MISSLRGFPWHHCSNVYIGKLSKTCFKNFQPENTKLTDQKRITICSIWAPNRNTILLPFGLEYYDEYEYYQDDTNEDKATNDNVAEDYYEDDGDAAIFPSGSSDAYSGGDSTHLYPAYRDWKISGRWFKESWVVMGMTQNRDNWITIIFRSLLHKESWQLCSSLCGLQPEDKIENSS